MDDFNKAEKIIDAVGMLPEEMIEEAASYNLKRNKNVWKFVPILASAACFVFIIMAARLNDDSLMKDAASGTDGMVEFSDENSLETVNPDDSVTNDIADSEMSVAENAEPSLLVCGVVKGIDTKKREIVIEISDDFETKLEPNKKYTFIADEEIDLSAVSKNEKVMLEYEEIDNEYHVTYLEMLVTHD